MSVTGRYREILERELAERDITWCRGGCGGRRSHDNGGAFSNGTTIHYNREISTRATLQIALHEIGHIVLGHTARTAGGRRQGPKTRAYEREAAADEWSFQRMRELGVPIPRRSRERSKRYVARKKARGDTVIAGRTRNALKPIKTSKPKTAPKRGSGKPFKATG